MTTPSSSSALGGGGKGGGATPGGWNAILSACGLPSLSSGPKRLGSLWAGYGEILELTAGQQRLIAKRVAPPRGDGDGDGEDVSHARKLRSYRVEGAFYRCYAPLMRADAARGGPAEGCPIAKPYLIQTDGDAEEGGGGEGGEGGDAMLLLLLEDLRGRFLPRQPRSYGLEEAKKALEWLASFHATWFERKWSVDVPSAAEEAKEAAERRRHKEAEQKGPPPPVAPDDADPHTPPLLWGSGCYWHLSTRQAEFQAIGGEWKQLAEAARDVDAALRGFGRGRKKFGTLAHGDAKAANFMFSADAAGAASGCAAVAGYDFQYVGGGYGPRDVAYLLMSSVEERVLASNERALLDHYRDALLAALAKRERGGAKGGAEGDPYPEEVLWRHYELSLLDLCRFEAGWGWWGSVRWSQRRAREILARLPEMIEAERRSVMTGE
jgi:hypothetical protein